MNTKMFTLISVSLAALAAAPVAAQNTTATAVADLEVYSGPGTQFGVIGSALTGEQLTVLGCETPDWCKVDSSAGEGWAYAPHLDLGDGATAASDFSASTAIEGDLATDDTLMPDTGIIAEAEVVAPAPVDAETSEFVIANPVEPVELPLEAVAGASVPADVEVHDIPARPDLAYLNLNGETVLLERQSRLILQVM